MPDRNDTIMLVTPANFRQFEERQRAVAERLKGGDGGGTSGGMEERVIRLEKNLDQLTKDVGDIRVDVATLKENVRHLPTKPWMFATLGSLLLIAVAVIGLLIRFMPHASA